MKSSYIEYLNLKFFLIALILIGLVTIGAQTYFQYTGYEEDDRVDVNLLSDGEVVDTINARTATTPMERYTGLSNTGSLSDGYGMIFIFDKQDDRTFVMRDMDFGLDIIFIDSNCSVNSIRHAREPISDQSGTEPVHQYNASSKYVLEVPYKYTENKISEGDSVDFYKC